MIRINSGYKLKDKVDLIRLIDFGFDLSPEYKEYYRYYRECEYLWVDKYTKIIDMTSPDYFCSFIRCKKVIGKLKKAGLLEQAKENIDGTTKRID